MPGARREDGPAPHGGGTAGKVVPVVAEEMRIARALSLLGYCSRREGERLLASGQVRVNGEIIRDPATKVAPGVDTITLAERRVQTVAPRRTIALNKPIGVVSTVRDPHADRTVVDLVPGPNRLYPVGRLDKDSEGLVLLTNDGDLANLVTHPRYGVEKEYLALVATMPAAGELQRLRTGVEIDGRLTSPAQVRIERQDQAGVWIRLTLREGRNREVRRMLGAVGLSVRRLIRTRIGTVLLANLAAGQHRELSPGEVSALRSGATPAPGSNLNNMTNNPSERPEETRHNWGSGPGALGVAQRIVAIDGPAGVGKTTVGMMLAERLNAAFLDTGVLYRALTLRAVERGVRATDGPELERLAHDLRVEVGPLDSDGVARVLLDGLDVTSALRSAGVDQQVSAVAAHPEVRAALVGAQRHAIHATRGVVVGRDIGTVIFPDATVKVFLQASPLERARRRADQAGLPANISEVALALAARDAQDEAREVAPLVAAGDAVVIDTDELTTVAVVDLVFDLVLRAEVTLG